MERALYRFIVPCTLAAVLLLTAACPGTPPEGDGGSEDRGKLEEPEPAPPANPPDPKLEPFVTEPWFERAPPPEVSLLLVANQRGKLKPCGCSEPQLGGLERLAVLVELARRRAGNGFAALSLGWSLSDRGEAQAATKAGLYRAALDVLGFDALLLGTPDLFVPALAQPFLDAPRRDRPTPPANAKLSENGLLALAAQTPPMADLTVRGVKFRLFSVVDPEQGPRLGGVADGVFPPHGPLQNLPARPDTVWIVSTDATGTTLDALAQALARKGPTVILDLTGGSGAVTVKRHRLSSGPLVVTLADLGKEVGFLDLDRVPPQEGGGWAASYHAVPLAPFLESMPRQAGGLRERVAALFEAYKQLVRGRAYLDDFPSYPAPGGVGYVGSSRCAGCHSGIYEEWLHTAHAKALTTLADKGYHWDPECVRCHVVGFQRLNDGRWGRIEGGFVNPDATPHLGGVGCECCHGPGSAHVARPYKKSLFAPGGPNVRHPGQKGCAVCHDVENSFGFNAHYEADFLPQVDHRTVPSDRRIGEPGEHGDGDGAGRAPPK